MNLLKNFYKRPSSLVAVAGLGLGGALILHSVLMCPAKINSASPKKHANIIYSQASISPGLPVQLKIPKINVDATVESVGLTAQGNLDTPKGPDGTGWYNQGPTPGEIGSAVIDGHFGWVGGIPAAFDNLNKLQAGDKLYVLGQKGATTTFVVRYLRTYGQNDIATAVFRSSDGKAHLNLITCEGTWNQSQQSYSNRIVAFADKETQP